ncbi:MAG: nucleotidyltransferase domain-containing protein [Candidatus Nanoarchaeia archaeon]|nr:nucleotidyltransferase domain-containing protein [Candidatus Nanoarchaeia archaeon]
MIETKENKILELFFIDPLTKLHLREISRRAKISPSWTKKILEKLEKQNLILKEKTRLTTNFTANRENINFINLKKIFNLHKLYKSNLLNYLEEIYEYPNTILLFGSYLRGEDIIKSDIDILIVTDKNKKLNLEKYEKLLKRKINIHETDLKNSDKEFLNNIINGLVLYGKLRLFK